MKILSTLLVFILSLHSENVEDSLILDAPDVYIDCAWCDIDFIKTEIPFVNYVIDRNVADIHILITTETTASGGKEYTMRFIGQSNYVGMNDTLSFVVAQFDSEDSVRRELAKKLKLGLMRYIAKTRVADEILISFVEKAEPTDMVDRWKNWVFTVSISSYLNGEQSSNYISTSGSFSANRITEDWKTKSSAYYNYRKSTFEIDDTTTISSVSKNYGSSNSIIRSINNHWSVGSWTNIYSNSYSNKKIGFAVWPAIEYNIYPYSQSTSRELRLSYRTGYAYHLYEEETIFDKTEEMLFYEAMSITLDTKQRWGSISTTFEGFHYFHDFTKNRLSLYSYLSLFMIRGLSFDLYGYASWKHDQLSLPKRDLTPEEILLEIKEQATHYNYSLSIGLTYSFGSLYSNVVNPRFGN